MRYCNCRFLRCRINPVRGFRLALTVDDPARPQDGIGAVFAARRRLAESAEWIDGCGGRRKRFAYVGTLTLIVSHAAPPRTVTQAH